MASHSLDSLTVQATAQVTEGKRQPAHTRKRTHSVPLPQLSNASTQTQVVFNFLFLLHPRPHSQCSTLHLIPNTVLDGTVLLDASPEVGSTAGQVSKRRQVQQYSPRQLRRACGATFNSLYCLGVCGGWLWGMLLRVC